jgi:CO/xanthine dehydrogenase Mo-binding subunit
MGQALMEHCIYDPESGQALAGSFMDYRCQRADDLCRSSRRISARRYRPRIRSDFAAVARAASRRRSA